MDIKELNKVVDFIEENLTEEIDYKDLSKIVGISEQILNRLYALLTGYSLSEYIRKRRLSKAFEELRKTDIKIIDLAIKYQYESDIAFTRAFKNMFGITPTECRISNDEYVLFPVAHFSNDNSINEFKYEIKTIEEKKIYCVKIEDENQDNLLYKIRELFKNISDIDDKYGVTILNNNRYEYYLGTTTKKRDLIELTIPKNQYIVFEVGNIEQSNINGLVKAIYKNWIPATSYKVDMNFTFEYYTEDNCYLYISVK